MPSDLTQPDFKVRCHVEGSGHFEVLGNTVGLRVGQRIHNQGREELWDSLRVDCRERADGSFEIEVVVFQPGWERPVRIAHMETASKGATPEGPALGINLVHAPVVAPSGHHS
jgi:hypothetical protein